MQRTTIQAIISCRSAILVAALSIGPFCHLGQAQQEAPPTVTVAFELDSGWAENEGTGLDVVVSFPVFMEGAAWMRLYFEDLTLSGDLLAGTGSILRMTALADGAVQEMDARHVQQWKKSSAYFNGDTVLVEILAQPGSGWNRAAMSRVTMGFAPAGDPSICGNFDDRVLSNDARVARLLPIGCTGWLIDDCQKCFLTAGHCTGSLDVVEFNVPLSDSGGGLNHPSPDDQYAVDASSLQTNGGLGVGDDWGYFGAFPNSNTGLSPGQAQGGAFVLVAPPSVSGNDIRITGCGTDSSPSTHNQVQQTHFGPMVTNSGTLVQYATDTTGGNSGSPVIWNQTGEAVGIHTHGGCSSSGGQNSGTSVSHPLLQSALASPSGICGSGISLTYDSDGLVPPGIPISVQATLSGSGGVVTLHSRLDGGAFQSQLMTPLGGNLYGGAVPAPSCGDSPEFYVSFQDATCGLITNPPDAPASFYSSEVGSSSAAFEDHFETDQGWTTSSSGATTGFWERGIPVNDPSWAYDPESDSDGSGSCYLTQNELGNTDVDNGSVSLTTPSLDFSGAGVIISYDYYANLSNDDGTDRLLVEARNGGSAWVTIETYTTSGSTSWRSEVLTGADFLSAGITLSDTVQMRFTGNDGGTATFAEYGLDNFFVGTISCDVVIGTSYCTTGVNGALISASGSTSVAANSLTLTANGVPANVNGIFFYGDQQTSIPLGGGTLCVSGTMGIFRLPPVVNSGASGQAIKVVDLTSPSNPFGVVTPGSTWNYQFWFRDGGSSDLTDALSILFTL